MPKNYIWRASNKLQILNADIYNIYKSIKPNSNNNKRYILSFIDDFTCKTWIYFSNENSKVFTMFKFFKTCVEKESSEYITYLRRDKGA